MRGRTIAEKRATMSKLASARGVAQWHTLRTPSTLLRDPADDNSTIPSLPKEVACRRILALDRRRTGFPAPVRLAALDSRRACHSDQPAVPCGRSLGEPSSIPCAPPGQGPDPQVSRVETLESNYDFDCEGRRRGKLARRWGCASASRGHPRRAPAASCYGSGTARTGGL